MSDTPESPDIEFMPWPHNVLYPLRCGGNGGCGALIVEGDIEVHMRWHQNVKGALRPVLGLPLRPPASGTW
jgi:hypothetical protein